MKPENEKFNEVVGLLRKSRPLLDSPEDIGNKVIRRLRAEKPKADILSSLTDFLFSWIYIGWVRRTLIAASCALVVVFIYQQGVILKRIDTLSKQTIVNNKANIKSPSEEIERLLTGYRSTGHLFSSRNITISEGQMKDLLESVKDLQIKYKDLEKIIDEDPDLKKMIEKKLMEIDHIKTNL
jgi:hypothetical protein